ncbi:MAG: hypothetical protein ACTSVI_03235 [Promethearchaeota archaeon]
MTEDLKLFKKRLTQLKNVLVTRDNVPQGIFYGMFKLDKDSADKEIVNAILKKHGFQLKKKNIILGKVKGDREVKVKAFLKDALPFFLKSFGVDKEALKQVPSKQEPEKPAALSLFSMQDQLKSEIEEAPVDDSTTIAEISTDIGVPIPEGSEDITEELGETSIPQNLPDTVKTPEISSELKTKEQESPTTPSFALSPEKDQVQDLSLITRPMPVTSARALEKKISLEEKLNLKAQQIELSLPGEEHANVASSANVKEEEQIEFPTIELDAQEYNIEDNEISSETESEASTGNTITAEIQAPQETTLEPTKVAPEPEISRETELEEVEPEVAQQLVAPEIVYEFYLCSRCGEEIKKTDILHAGNYLQCPKCSFKFSKNEAKIIKKKPEELLEIKATKKKQEKSDKVTIEESDYETLVRPSQLFGNKTETVEKTETLIRPSQLFGQGKKPGARVEAPPALKKPPITQKKEHEQKKSIGNGEHLVRPSDFLKIRGEKLPEDKNEYEPIKQIQQQTRATIPTTPASRKMKTEERLVRPSELMQASQGPKENNVEERLVRPSELMQASQAPKETLKCPRCGSTKFTKIQDRTKIISYNPLIYGFKKKCVNCSFEFD